MAKPLRDLHDVELAGLAAAGGRREFGELVRRHGSTVRGLLRRMGAQPALADDVAQDAFLLAFEKCAEFRGEGTFAAWIKRIAARLYLKRISKEAR
jgi:RNA polymerase sigma-70 factor (ECF subfamily)